MTPNRLSSVCAALLAPTLLALGLNVAQAAVITGRSALGTTNANILSVNPDGVGHVLLYPYYSAGSGNITLLSLTNTDTLNAKAVKVRLRAAQQGDAVFDLTVFLAPNDVWNAVVSRDAATGGAQLSTADTSCTLPALVANVPVAFGAARINPQLSSGERLAQTLDGYVEAITLADIPVSLATGSLYQSITHVNGVPRNCGSAAVLATLTDAVNEGAAAAMGFLAPTTGLQGSWSLLNVTQSLTFSGAPTAVQALDNGTGLPGRANYVLFPQTSAPATGVDGLTADPLLRSNPAASKTAAGVTTAYTPASGGLPVWSATLSDFPDLSTPYLAALTVPSFQSSELSRVLAVKSVANDFATDSAIAATTDWVFTLPTRRYSQGTDYRGSVAASVWSSMSVSGTEFFHSSGITLQGALAGRFYDREGNLLDVAACSASCATGFGVGPAVSVVGFGASATATGAASVIRVKGVPFVNGWGKVDTANGGVGLPMIGFGLTRATNPAASAGVAGNYGVTTGHTVSR